MTRVYEAYRVPDRVIPWIKAAISKSTNTDDAVWDKKPESSVAPWREADEDDDSLDYITIQSGNLIKIVVDDDGYYVSVDKLCIFLQHLLRQIGDTFLVWSLTWNDDEGGGACAISIFEEKYERLGDIELRLANELRARAIK